MQQRLTLASYQNDDGPRTAAILGKVAFDVATVTGEARHRDMIALIEDWERAERRIREHVDAGYTEGTRDASALALIAPVPRPGAVYFAGANFADHISEMRKVPLAPIAEYRAAMPPWHLLKSSHTVVGPGSAVAIPDEVGQLDWEAELVVVIGQKASRVAERDALRVVFGYTIANDLSARDLARRSSVPQSSAFHFDWLNMKSFDGSCPTGPWIVPARDVDNPQALDIKLSVNGNLKQSSSTSQMIYSIAEQISFLSRRLTLWPGDMILTGTPAGVGAGHGEYLHAGDEVCVSIGAIGELRHSIVG